MTVAIPKEGDMIAGKLQLSANGWVVLASQDGKIITSYPFDKNRQSFEENENQQGKTIYEHSINSETRKILKRVFGLS